MKYTGIFEKLLLIFEMIESSIVYGIVVGVVIFTLFLMFKKVISKKSCFIINLTAIVSLIIYTIFNYYSVLIKVFDSIMNNLFTNIYFPSVYSYLFILIFVNIVGFTSLFKVTLSKIYKTINGVCLLMIDFILVLILEVIAKNQIDVFSKVSLFSNVSLVMLLEFSVNVFISWLIVITIVYLTNLIVERKHIMATNYKLINAPAVIEPVSVNLGELENSYLSGGNKFVTDDLFGVNLSGYKEEVKPQLVNNNSYKFVPVMERNNQFIGTNSFDLSSFIPRPSELSPITSNVELNNVISKEFESINVERKTLYTEERDSYTLNDYKIFNKMLKDIKEHNEGSVISIDKNLEYRLITKYSTEKYDMFKKMLKIYS